MHLTVIVEVKNLPGDCFSIVATRLSFISLMLMKQTKTTVVAVVKYYNKMCMSNIATGGKVLLLHWFTLSQ